jgi:type VI secretion system lysozyme-like protein
MTNIRLLQRFRQWEKQNTHSIEVIEFDVLVDSILQDINQLFNTRKGSVLMDAQLGCEDFTSLLSSMAQPELEQLCLSFKLLCQSYEKRLQNCLIEYEFRESDMGVIRFICLASIEHQEQNKPIKFFILLQGDGSVSIEINQH